MNGSLWDSTAEQLLRRTSSADPTPGGGSIAALTASFGLALLLMALEVTLSSEPDDADLLVRLTDAHSRARELQAEVVKGVDGDVAEFEALMASYRMPRETEEERAVRDRAIEDATVTATHGPLGLAETALVGIALGDEIESLVKSTIVSDVQAGRDLLRGAALAALRTADINLLALVRSGHVEGPGLRERRDSVFGDLRRAEGPE